MLCENPIKSILPHNISKIIHFLVMSTIYIYCTFICRMSHKLRFTQTYLYLFFKLKKTLLISRNLIYTFCNEFQSINLIFISLLWWNALWGTALCNGLTHGRVQWSGLQHTPAFTSGLHSNLNLTNSLSWKLYCLKFYYKFLLWFYGPQLIRRSRSKDQILPLALCGKIY